MQVEDLFVRINFLNLISGLRGANKLLLGGLQHFGGPTEIY